MAGIPGDPSTYYAGAASGGVWKSHRRRQALGTRSSTSSLLQAIGALAVAPSDPSTVWAGTGEAWAIRDSDMMGNGIYKSTDAGKTWTNMGLPDSGRIGRIVIHPTNPDIVFACVAGRLTGPQQERGVYRTTDGGQTGSASCSSTETPAVPGSRMDPNDPAPLVAGMWQVEMHT